MCPVCSGGASGCWPSEHTAEPLLWSHSFRSCACPQGSCQLMPPDSPLPSMYSVTWPCSTCTRGTRKGHIKDVCIFLLSYNTLLGVITVHFIGSFTGSQGKDDRICNRHIKDKILNLYLATVASFYLCFTERVMGSKGENEILVWFGRELTMGTGIPLCFGTHQRSAGRPIALWTLWANGQVLGTKSWRNPEHLLGPVPWPNPCPPAWFSFMEI